MDQRRIFRGLIINYILPDGPHAGATRAAVVTNHFPPPAGQPPVINGTIFLDELNDAGSARYFGSARYDDSPRPAHGTWHFIGPTDPPDPG